MSYDNDNTTKLKIQVLNKGNIPPYALVKAYWQGSKFVDVTYCERKAGCNITMMKGGRYVIHSTGEIKEVVKNNPDKKLENKKRALRNTFTRLQRLIRTNFTENSMNQQMLTLTYRENMQDPEKLYTDFKKWFQKLKRLYPQHNFEYISVAEPQGRGAWHLHLMIKTTNQPELWFDYVKLSQMWNGENNSVDGQRLKSSDVGTYYVTYFTNLELDANKLISEKDKRKNKGSRLKYYPANFKFFRCSRGIARPNETMEESQMFETEEYNLQYERAYNIIEEKQSVDEEEEKTERILNTIVNRTYRRTTRKGAVKVT